MLPVTLATELTFCCMSMMCAAGGGQALPGDAARRDQELRHEHDVRPLPHQPEPAPHAHPVVRVRDLPARLPRLQQGRGEPSRPRACLPAWLLSWLLPASAGCRRRLPGFPCSIASPCPGYCHSASRRPCLPDTQPPIRPPPPPLSCRRRGRRRRRVWPPPPRPSQPS